VFSFVLDDFYDSQEEEEFVTTNNSLLVIGEIPQEHVNKLVWMPIIPGGRHWVNSLFIHILINKKKGDRSSSNKDRR